MLKKPHKFHNRQATIARTGRITGAPAIAVLASPARQEIIDTVEALGGAATIAELAAQLGRPADGLYYHVHRLVRAGLLVVEGALYHTPAGRRDLALDYRPDDPRVSAALRRVVGSMLRIARRDFDAGLALPEVAVRGPRRALWAGRAKGWVGPRELAEINLLVARIQAILRRPRRAGNDQLASWCFVLAPIAARPVRRASRGRNAPRRTRRAAFVARRGGRARGASRG